MTTCTTRLACLIGAALANGPLLAAVQPPTPLVLTPPVRRTICRGRCWPASSLPRARSCRPTRGRDNQPRLTALRKSLLLVRPLQAGNQAPLALEARDGAGKLLGSLTLDPPSRLPKTAYYLEGTPEEGSTSPAPAPVPSSTAAASWPG